MSQSTYQSFRNIDGRHPLRSAVPGGFIDYRVRTRHGAQVFYFNFALAREMGLLAKSHPDRLTAGLRKILIDTFALQIINEYDLEHGVTFPEADIRPYPRMATRYLQLQHPGRTGVTSGDGRSIWNGSFRHRGTVWDISSCGTGATALSPASAKEQRFFKTGDKKVSYGCGRAELQDGFCAALMSEIFHRQEIPTERTLAILSYPDGTSINVRAARNLLRPAHFFMHIKQGNLQGLRQVTDYFIDRQIANGDWPAIRERKKAYRYLLKRAAFDFARAAARFESDYIFCWLDWDGDNILMDGGIIDYGSLRQFGLYHHEYRYDDVERMSTTITEQKNKARYIVQTFAQGMEFLLGGKKHNIRTYHNHWALKLFDQLFTSFREERLLYRIGFTPEQIQSLLASRGAGRVVRQFMSAFSYFEKAKSARGPYQVSDGIMWNAVFCMRDILRELPLHYLHNREQRLTPGEMIGIIRSNYAGDTDVNLTHYRRTRLADFQEGYLQLVDKAARLQGRTHKQVLRQIARRSAIINRYDRITGDGIIHASNRLVNEGLNRNARALHQLTGDFINSQVLNPDRRPVTAKTGPGGRSHNNRTMVEILQTISDCREGI